MSSLCKFYYSQLRHIDGSCGLLGHHLIYSLYMAWPVHYVQLSAMILTFQIFHYSELWRTCDWWAVYISMLCWTIVVNVRTLRMELRMAIGFVKRLSFQRDHAIEGTLLFVFFHSYWVNSPHSIAIPTMCLHLHFALLDYCWNSNLHMAKLKSLLQNIDWAF